MEHQHICLVPMRANLLPSTGHHFTLTTEKLSPSLQGTGTERAPSGIHIKTLEDPVHKANLDLTGSHEKSLIGLSWTIKEKHLRVDKLHIQMQVGVE